MAKGSRGNFERLLRAAYDFQRRKRNEEEGIVGQHKKNLVGKVFAVIEQPLVLGSLFAVGGLVGAVIFTPALILCAICVLLGVHRAGVLTGQPKKTQTICYLGLALILSIGGYFLYGTLDKALERFQSSFAKRVADFNNRSENAERERADVKYGLIADAHLPPDQNVWKSKFTVHNTSRIDIGKHQISCVVKRITTESLSGGFCCEVLIFEIWRMDEF